MANTISSFPIDFDLYDEEDQQVLFITDDKTGQGLTFEVTNTSDKSVSPKLLTGAASVLNSHFELVFRPGTLYNVKPAIAIQSDQLELFMDKEGENIKANADGTLSLFFKSKSDWTLQEGKKMLIKLSHIKAEATNGTRGTRVMLRYRNLLHAGNQDVFSGFREMHLNIVNHQGKKNIPLTAGFVSSNMVLNDGVSSNTLRLRVINTSKMEMAVEASLKSKLILTMEVGTKDQPWALITDDKKDVTVTYSRSGDTGSTEVKTAPVWEIPFTTLNKGQFIDIVITNLVTSLPSGHATIFLHYENIPGYWDGDMALVVEKGPLVFKNKNVGIGTTEPYFSLDVKGKIGLRNNAAWDHMFLHHDGVTGYLTAGGAESGLALRVGAGGEAYEGQDYKDVMRLFPNGDVNIGPVQNSPAGTLHLYSSGVETATVKGGKVGIGNTNPATAKLVIGGGSGEEGLDLASSNQIANLRVLRNSLSTADKDMFIGYQSGPNSSLHLYSDNNETVTVKGGKAGIGINTPLLSLDVKGKIGLRNDAAWDHMYFHHDGVAGYITAGGAEAGMVLRVGSGGGGGYEGQDYREVLRLMPSGRVGINNGSPTCPLHVSGFVDYDLGGGFYFMFRDQCRQAAGGSHMNSIAIRADFGIQSNLGLYCTSDRRIKTAIQPCDQSTALELLKKLEVVDYQHKDFVTMGTRIKKGFIAQDIEAMFPEAIAKSTDFIPDLYDIPEKATLESGSLAVTMKAAHNLVPGDVVRLVTKENSMREVPVSILDERTFRVQDWDGSAEHLFVYGKQVNDFMTLDYDYVFCTGISAVQQLSRQVDDLKARLHAQESRVKQLEECLHLPVVN